MQTFRTEGNYRSADRLSPAELRAAIASREILQSTALAFDTQRQLRFDLGGVKAVMPFGQCADGAESGTVRDIAVLTRVGRPTCFVIEGMETGENGQPCYLLSRAEAQRMCKAEYLDTHQIRAHMKHIGHPLFNDERYGGNEILRGTQFSKYKQFIQNCFAVCPRQALHARTLGFIHPRSGQEMYFTSELPADMTALLERWRSYTAHRDME